jgi:hypothetical protein
VALDVLPETLPHQDFLMFRTKVFAAFDLLFSEENVFPPSEAGKTRVHSFYLYHRISVVSTLLAYETLCDMT